MNGNDICAAVKNKMGDLFACEMVGEYLCIRTPYLYPDGDVIDLYCEQDGDGVLVTDMGETTGWLQLMSVAPRRTPRQNKLIEGVCRTHGVEFYRGMLQASCRPGDDLADVCNRVAQASLRVSDIWFTFHYPKTASAASTADDVAKYLSKRRLEYKRAKKMAGRSGHEWKVDFHVENTARGSLVYVLDKDSRAAADRRADHVVAAWHDLSHLNRRAAGPNGLEFVTLFDDAVDIWRDEDFRRVESLSAVARWSQPDEFVKMLLEPA